MQYDILGITESGSLNFWRFSASNLKTKKPLPPTGKGI
jgi:hypothetical protein